MIKNNIIRVQKNKDNPYLILNKKCINDKNLSWAAKGLHTYLLSLPDDWTIYVTELINHTCSGRDSTYTAIKELMKFGYMSRFEYRYKGKIKASNYCVYEIAIDVSNCDNTKATIIKINENGEIIDDTLSKPYTEKPNTGNPDTFFPTLINNNESKLINQSINNNDKEYDLHEKYLLDLYKSFKLEKRVMPHTVRLLKQNVHISIEVFEQLFINATSKDNVYRYLQEVLKDLNENSIRTLDEFNHHIKIRKTNKRNKTIKENTNNHINQKYNKFKNFTENFMDNYKDDNEFNKYIDEIQSEKWD